ncbi:MAG: class I SAM-dependent methyltransferase [Pseudomonadota bacterium]
MEGDGRAEGFRKILDAYAERRREPGRPTSRGMWVSSTAAEVFELLAVLDAERCRRFVDLGSGDGLVTCIASLFCPATGIEADAALVAEAGALRDRLGLKAEFICGDFLREDLSRYDLLYIYPDKPLSPVLEEVLAEGGAGRLVVYGCHFPPGRLSRVKTVQLATCQAAVYQGLG